MKIKRVLIYVGISLIALPLLVVAGLFIWSATSTYPAGEMALAALEPSETVRVSQDDWITFSPENPSETGLIFYPGGLVEPEAYTPVLREIAEHGILVVITPMPLNLAILNTNAANAVFEAYPEISDWVLAGHSLGGASAAIYANGNPDKINALALWDSYPPDSADLSNSNLTVLSIYGTTDGIPNTDNFDNNTYLLPPDTLFIAIEGGSHAQFGDYGPQAGDVTPSISAADQHAQVVEAMLTFINK
ncbi:MAG: alpha/beta hydrolase [Chloroflexi bacterium]|nr:MAG: alpha/beta hydrolase [Chloroflexota bacterium]MBL1193872.1 alpha/beta hydrolase [Chloroflexota bacterium]NOH11166.1 alpha/beta hydrolase [Chloroflexota bacterium]